MRTEATLELGLDEIAHAGPEHLDPGYVARYDRRARVEPDDDVALLREHGLDRDGTLIDLGAGTGTFAIAAAAHCARVVAVDVSPAMVAELRRKTAQSGVGNVQCVQAGFLSYRHDGASPDVIYTRNALHHLPDLWKAIALQRMAALLRPGGVLYLRDLVFAFDLRHAGTYIRAWLETGCARPEDGWTRPELEAHLRDEYSTFSWLLKPMIEQAGLRIDSARHDSSKVYARYLCRKI